MSENKHNFFGAGSGTYHSLSEFLPRRAADNMAAVLGLVLVGFGRVEVLGHCELVKRGEMGFVATRA
jgi:hypothetical protein